MGTNKMLVAKNEIKRYDAEEKTEELLQNLLRCETANAFKILLRSALSKAYFNGRIDSLDRITK